MGSASPTRSWLLVEEPGPWGPGAVPTSRLGEDVTARLRAVAARLAGRLLLIRRPGPERRDPTDRALFRVTCTRGSERVQVKRCAPDDVAAAAADDAGWQDHDGVLLLVCTHGRKDWCCALRGRPVAAALAEADPDAAWECSHLGGDRFAATVLALPSGCTYGRVDAADVGALAAAERAGEVVAGSLRGRCTDAMVVQAADVHARLGLGRTGRDDLVPSGARREADELTWAIRFDDAVTGGVVDVRVRQSHVERAQRLTCGAGEEQHARTWDLVELLPGEPVGAGS